MLCGGGGSQGLQYVDIEAAKNGGYGYLQPNNYFSLNDNDLYVCDYVKFLKTGNGNPIMVGISDWRITNKQSESPFNTAIVLTFTHITSGFSFRASLKQINRPWTVQRMLITEDNPQLYEELKQNASWL